MKQIITNLVIGMVWVALTIGQVRLLFMLNEQMSLGTAGTLVAWLGGQLVILSPVVWTIWRDRRVGSETG